MTAKDNRVKARLPRGLFDRGSAEIDATRRMIDRIRAVFERYGFEPVETPAIEYTDALGKFLPDQDRPNEGVFSFQDDDEQWLSLRYDLTAPLARYVAENFEKLPKPYRSYRVGWVFRNEKPGPGRFRQFMQFDADTVSSPSMAADAEMCMMAADTMEALGIPRRQYVVKVNNRKMLDGILEIIGRGGEENVDERLSVMRAIDKLDRIGVRGVQQLLGPGRKDDSGDYTKGAQLPTEAINVTTSAITQIPYVEFTNESATFQQEILKFDTGNRRSFDFNEYRQNLLSRLKGKNLPEMSETGLRELEEISKIVAGSGYEDRVKIDPSVVRGLEYYTGPVFEVDLTFETPDEDGRPVRFGSVGGGGRYDGLIARFRGESVPATGFSIGVSRLAAALAHIGKTDAAAQAGPVVVLAMERERIGEYQRLAKILRDVGIRAEIYLGTSGMKAQMKYADRRGAPCVVIQGSDERAKGEVQIKDLIEGEKAAAAIATHQEWHESRPAQFAVAEEKLVDAVREVLRRHGVNWE
jgi:histidyl-tRNA synthetase